MARSGSAHIGPAFDSVLAAAQRNAPWAYDRLWRAYAPLVVSYLRVQGAGDAEDLASEVFLGAFRSLPTFTGEEDAFRAWLFTIAHRRLTDDRRRAGVRPRVADTGGDAFGLERRGGDVEDDAWRRLGAERVRDLCAKLAPGQRDVLLLRLIADLTIEQVAEALGSTSGAIKQLQRRGLLALRQMIETEELASEGVPL